MEEQIIFEQINIMVTKWDFKGQISTPLCFVCCTGLFLADMGEHVKETWQWKLNWNRSFIKAIRTLTVNNSYNCSMRLV